MKERLVTLALALGAFALFYALFAPKPANVAQDIALPVSTEEQDDGYLAMWRWLQAQRIPVLSFRDRYGALGRQGSVPAGNILVATVPQQVPARLDEMQALEAWIAAGNTLLVMAAMDDTPAWAVRAPGNVVEQLVRLTQLQFSVIKAPASKDEEKVGNTTQSVRRAVQQMLEPAQGSIIAKGAHPLLAGVRSVATQSRYPASRWAAQSTDEATLLELAVRADKAEGADAAEPAMWLRRHGQGQVIVLGFASPLSNAMLGKQDNARLFANIIAWSRSASGAVLFDDAHQGLVNYYDARAFFADPRLHRTLLWAGLLWLLFVLGWQRLRPHRDDWNPVDVTTFIKVTGGFLAGKVAVNLVGQRLLQNFFNRIRQRLALPQDGAPVWDWLAVQASIPPADLQRLRQLHARAHTRQRVDLVQLQNCLGTIMGRLK
jgi:hypothetical protein